MVFWNSCDYQGAFLADSLLKGHQKSLEATNSFVNSLKRDRTLGMGSSCLSHQDASTDRLQSTATSPISIITWPWRLVKLWPLPFKVKQYIFRSYSTRETRSFHYRFFIFNLRPDGGGALESPPSIFSQIARKRRRRRRFWHTLSCIFSFNLSFPLTVGLISTKLWHNKFYRPT